MYNYRSILLIFNLNINNSANKKWFKNISITPLWKAVVQLRSKGL